MKIEINGKFWELNVEEAVRAKVLTRTLKNGEQIVPGDVFAHPTGNINNLLLVEAVNEYGNCKDSRFQLLGYGTKCNSNYFYEKLNSLESIKEYLVKNDMFFLKNIQNDITKLVNP